MKILWYHDMPLEYNGGAELSIASWQDVGIEMGHTFYNVNVKTVSDLQYYIDKSDIAFISNTYFTHDQHVDRICKKLPYIKNEHDVGYCYLRDPHCRKWIEQIGSGFEPPCEMCSYIKNEDERLLAEKHFIRYNEMMNKAKAISFSSPAQFKVFIDALGDHGKPPAILRLPAIQVDYFNTIDETKKRHGTMFVADYGSKKGVPGALLYGMSLGHDIPMTLVGSYPSEFVLPSNFRVFEKTGMKQMNILYNKHEYVLQCPEVFDACPRVYFEARLAGCTPLLNDNVGATSWGWTDDTSIEKIRKKLKEAPGMFWDNLEEFL